MRRLTPYRTDSEYVITSPQTRDYNCIAWAMGDTTAWWWPNDDPNNEAIYWPIEVSCEETLASFVAAFATLSYQPCDQEVLEPGFEKIALFADAQSVPTHAARQLPSGRWTSKLGFLEDIEHALHDLSGEKYGVVIQVFKRPITLIAPNTAREESS